MSDNDEKELDYEFMPMVKFKCPNKKCEIDTYNVAKYQRNNPLVYKCLICKGTTFMIIEGDKNGD